MDITLQGIVIHTIRYNDHQIIARIFTEEHGLKSFLVRSGKTPKTSKLHLIQPLSLVEFESSLKENARIHSIKNLRSAHPWQAIPFHPGKSSIVLFLNEVLYKTIPDDYFNEPLFRFLWDALILLDDSWDEKNFHIWCLLEITRHYGFYPWTEHENAKYFDMQNGQMVNHFPGHNEIMDGESVAILLQMLEREWPEVQDMALHSQLRSELLNGMVRYIRLHTDNLREIKSLEVLREVFHGK